MHLRFHARSGYHGEVACSRMRHFWLFLNAPQHDWCIFGYFEWLGISHLHIPSVVIEMISPYRQQYGKYNFNKVSTPVSFIKGLFVVVYKFI